MATHKRVNTFVDKRPKPAKKLKKQKLLDGESTPSEAEVMVKLEPDCNAIPGAGAKQRLRNDGNESNCVNQEHDRDKASSMLFHVLNKEFTAALVPEMEKTVFEKKTKIKKVKHKPKCGTENKLPSKQRPETSNKMTMTIIKEEEKEDSNNGVTVKLEPVSDTEEELPVFFERKEDLSRFRQLMVAPFDKPEFFMVSNREPMDQVLWLQCHGLLVAEMVCHRCSTPCKLQKRTKVLDGVTWRCADHEISVRTNSFFHRAHFSLQEILLFVKLYLDGNTLYDISRQCGISYQQSAIDWAGFVRELFKEHVKNDLENLVLTGTVVVVASVFGDKKRNCRRSTKGCTTVWVFGLIEYESNTFLLYPVENRDSGTIERIVMHHVQVGSRVLTKVWPELDRLSELGYEHYCSVNKMGFPCTYQHVQTGVQTEINTITIENIWRKAKEHLQRMNGSKLPHFEGHLAEIVWRNSVRHKNLYAAFMDLLRSVYTLREPATYKYTTPLFDTWFKPWDDIAELSIIPCFHTNSDYSMPDETEYEWNSSASFKIDKRSFSRRHKKPGTVKSPKRMISRWGKSLSKNSSSLIQSSNEEKELTDVERETCSTENWSEADTVKVLCPKASDYCRKSTRKRWRNRKRPTLSDLPQASVSVPPTMTHSAPINRKCPSVSDLPQPSVPPTNAHSPPISRKCPSVSDLPQPSVPPTNAHSPPISRKCPSVSDLPLAPISVPPTSVSDLPLASVSVPPTNVHSPPISRKCPTVSDLPQTLVPPTKTHSPPILSPARMLTSLTELPSTILPVKLTNFVTNPPCPTSLAGVSSAATKSLRLIASQKLSSGVMKMPESSPSDKLSDLFNCSPANTLLPSESMLPQFCPPTKLLPDNISDISDSPQGSPSKKLLHLKDDCSTATAKRTTFIFIKHHNK